MLNLKGGLLMGFYTGILQGNINGVFVWGFCMGFLNEDFNWVFNVVEFVRGCLGLGILQGDLNREI